MNLDGIELDALIDTGSMVTTITESFYNDNLIAVSPLVVILLCYSLVACES